MKYSDKTLSFWQKLLRRFSLVRYKDFERCRDALSKIGQGHEGDKFVMDALDISTFICDYPDVTARYPECLRED